MARQTGLNCRTALTASVLLLVVIGATTAAHAQPTPPRPDPGAEPHIFYGETPDGGDEAPILLFVHGLRGRAADWWADNDMYRLAFEAGYRTAFININRDLTRNDASIAANAAELRQLLPRIAVRFGAETFYVVTHSKGGVDVQAALLEPDVASLVSAVFMISPPSHGTALADWAFGEGQEIAEELGLLTPGVFAMKTDTMAAFRATADPMAAEAGIPYFTMAGSTSLGNPLTAVTGSILDALTGGEVNDGLVTMASTRLPEEYATDLGAVPTHHFRTRDGYLAFPRIHAAMQALLGRQPFERIATEGFGDRHNSWAWSMKWFKGRLYVGTGRAFLCMTGATADRQIGTNIYRPSGPDIECAPTPEDLPLAAEIWRYTPATEAWERVFQSEEDVPVEIDDEGQPTKVIGRDIAYRGMVVHREPDGTEALYVAGVGGGSVFGENPPYDQPGVQFPPPRILRTVDGEQWAPLPQEPGTFLGDISQERPGAIQVRGFRSMESFRGKLFVTATDFRGVGVLFASETPAAGNDAWRQVSPSAEELPIWTLRTWNGFLYMTTGDGQVEDGYGVYKTAAIGPGPYRFLPVVTEGAFGVQPWRSRSALSLMEFKGKLYVGSNRPTELIRLNRDDSWELVVGGPRQTPSGIVRPISGLLTGFGNLFNGHFWRMATHDGSLYLGTWDWSIGLRVLPAWHATFRHEYGFDFFTTEDGRFWRPISKTGFGDAFNYGVRTLESTPAGLFVGTANPFYGLQVWRSTDPSAELTDPEETFGDAATERTHGSRGYDRSMNGHPAAEKRRETRREKTSGKRNEKRRGSSPLAAVRLESVSDQMTDGMVLLAWDASARADHYQVWRSVDIPILDLLPPDFSFQIPGTDITIGIPEIQEGALDRWCRGMETAIDCDLLEAIRDGVGVPGPFELEASTTDRFFVDESAPRETQSRYYVVAVDRRGHPSAPSNVVGGPSAAAPVTFETIAAAISAAVDAGQISESKRGGPKRASALEDLLSRSASALAYHDLQKSQRWLTQLARAIVRQRSHAAKASASDSTTKRGAIKRGAIERGIDVDVADDLLAMVESLGRHLSLVEAGYISADPLLP